MVSMLWFSIFLCYGSLWFLWFSMVSVAVYGFCGFLWLSLFSMFFYGFYVFFIVLCISVIGFIKKDDYLDSDGYDQESYDYGREQCAEQCLAQSWCLGFVYCPTCGSTCYLKYYIKSSLTVRSFLLWTYEKGLYVIYIS